MKEFNIYIVDRSRLYRQGLKRLFASSPFFVIGESDEIDEVTNFNIIENSEIEFLIIDFQEDHIDIFPKVSDLLEIHPLLKIIILSDTIDLEILSGALKSGVRGYLLKDISPDALLQSLLLVETGEKVFPSGLAHLLVDSDLIQKAPRTLKSSGSDGLSKRERQILDGLVQGQSNKTIARALDVAEGTVKVHLKSLLRKIKARNRTQAAIWGLSHGGTHAQGNAEPEKKPQQARTRITNDG